MSRKHTNYAGQLFKCSGKPKLWEELKLNLTYGSITVYM